VAIELWSKEAPKACRNFLQLAMEGRYDDCIFHRIINNFLVQTGDPTGKGDGGESAFGEPFPNELHSRLKFRNRGLVAMSAEEGEGNRSQFFITLGACEWLNGKNTIFGKVVGDTIFNVIRMGELEVDAHDRPLYPPKIKQIDITTNPFDDILPRVTVRRGSAGAEGAQKKLAAPAVKNKTLLSFAEDGDEEEDEDVPAKVAVHPSMQTAERTNDDGPKEAASEIQAKPSKEPQEQLSTGASKRHVHLVSESEDEDSSEDQSSDDAKRAKRPREEDRPGAPAGRGAVAEYHRLRDEIVKKKRTAKASLSGRKEDARRLETEAQFVSPLEARRAKYLYRRRVADAGGRESSTLDKLKAFSSNLKKSESDGEDADEGDKSWMNHALEFPRDVHNQDDGYVVQDPLEGKRGKHGESLKRHRDRGGERF